MSLVRWHRYKRGHLTKKRGKGKYQKEWQKKNRGILLKILAKAERGITQSEASRQSCEYVNRYPWALDKQLSWPTVHRHFKDFEKEGIVERKGDLYFLKTSNYEQAKRVDEFFDFLFQVDIQRRRQSPQRRYEIIDIGQDSFLRDRITGKKMITVHWYEK